MPKPNVNPEVVDHHGFYISSRGELYWGIPLWLWGQGVLLVKPDLVAKAKGKTREVLARLYRLVVLRRRPKKASAPAPEVAVKPPESKLAKILRGEVPAPTPSPVPEPPPEEEMEFTEPVGPRSAHAPAST